MWLSNNFLITLFGGMFASMLVVGLCEVQKYLSAKSYTEQYIFFQGMYLYQALEQMRVIVTDYLEHQELQITENLFDESIRMIQSEIYTLQNTDYATFKQKQDSLMYEHGRFRVDTLRKMIPILQSGIKLKIAINKEQQANLKKQIEMQQCGQGIIITSKCGRVRHVLNAEAERLFEATNQVDLYLSVDGYCRNRFKWKEIKGKMRFPHVDEWMRQ